MLLNTYLNINTMESNYENARKPNQKVWTCPFNKVTMNSRGAAAYLRNKYNISWNKKYLSHPELLAEQFGAHAQNELYCKIIEMLSDVESENKELLNQTIEEIYNLIFRIKINYRNKNTTKILEIHKCIYPITSSKLAIKKKE